MQFYKINNPVFLLSLFSSIDMYVYRHIFDIFHKYLFVNNQQNQVMWSY